jgi:hypothetical protein
MAVRCRYEESTVMSVLQDFRGRALPSLTDLLGQYEDLRSAISSFRTVAPTLFPEMKSLINASTADMSPTPTA